MWAYFNCWDSVDLEDKDKFRAMERLIRAKYHIADADYDMALKEFPSILVPTTRALSRGEEKQLVKYFCDSGPKLLPKFQPDPYVPHDGTAHEPDGLKGMCLAFSSEAMKEMVKLAAADTKIQIESVSVAFFLAEGHDTSGVPRSVRPWGMWVKRMKVKGKEELLELAERAYENVHAAAESYSMDK